MVSLGVKIRKILNITLSDIVVWDKKTSLCMVIDISVPLHLNITNENQDKRNEKYSVGGRITNFIPIIQVPDSSSCDWTLWERDHRTERKFVSPGI